MKELKKHLARGLSRTEYSAEEDLIYSIIHTPGGKP